jgi:adenine-specific DNA glycosylase
MVKQSESPADNAPPSSCCVTRKSVRHRPKVRCLTLATDVAVKIEQDLNRIVPPKDWIYFPQSMVLHGRYICVARTPRCFECFLADVCPCPDELLKRPPDGPAEPRKTITGFPILFRK